MTAPVVSAAPPPTARPTVKELVCASLRSRSAMANPLASSRAAPPAPIVIRPRRRIVRLLRSDDASIARTHRSTASSCIAASSRAGASRSVASTAR
jgi:hypothetical protein